MDKKYLLSVFVYLVTGVLAIALILFVVYHLAGFDDVDYTTAVARSVEAEIGFEADGYVFRKETVLSGGASGRAYSGLADGENVGKGDELCGVYAQNDSLFDELEKTDRLLAILKESRTRGGLAEVNAETRKLASGLRTAMLEGNVSQRGQTDDSLLAALDRRSSVTGGTLDTEREIVLLEEERAKLIKRLGTRIETIYAPFAGNYFSVCDGYEGVFDYDAASTLDPASFDSLIASLEEMPAGKAGKLVDSSLWRLVMKTDKENAVALVAGRKYTVEFAGGGKAEMKLERIAADPRAGETLLVFSSRTEATLAPARREKAKVLVSAEKGLMVPTAAIRTLDGKLFKDGKEGETQVCVYVLNGNKIRLKKVEILTEQQGYYVVKDYTGDKEHSGFLQVNDLVITAGKDISEGYAQ